MPVMLSQVSVISPVVLQRVSANLLSPFPHIPHAVLAEAIHDIAGTLSSASRMIGRVCDSARLVSFAIFSYEHQSYFR